MRISSWPYWLVIAYLIIHSLYILTARFPPRRRGRVLFVNGLLAALFLLVIALLDSQLWQASRTFRIIVLWAPVAFFWWAYLRTGLTLNAYYPPDVSFDASLIRLEERLFRQPSLWLGLCRQPWVTDLLNSFYNTYYLYTLAVGLYLHINGKINDFQAMTLAVILGYAGVYSFFPWMPVWGPRWGLVAAGMLEPSRQRVKGGWMTRATDRLMYEGLAHKGCAMPSAHTSTAVVFLVWCWRIWGPPGGIPASVIVAGMAIGAVYGRYHYLVDLIVGAAVGVACVLVADRLI